MPDASALAGLVAFNGLLLCAAATDLRRYRIPNALPALLALAGLALAWPHSLPEAASRAASVAVVGVVAGALWLRGVIGGGDVKLLAACAVWIPLGGLPVFATSLGLASGAQGATALAATRLVARVPLAVAARARIPYALSIAAAGLAWSVVQLNAARGY